MSCHPERGRDSYDALDGRSDGAQEFLSRPESCIVGWLTHARNLSPRRPASFIEIWSRVFSVFCSSLRRPWGTKGWSRCRSI